MLTSHHLKLSLQVGRLTLVRWHLQDRIIVLAFLIFKSLISGFMFCRFSSYCSNKYPIKTTSFFYTNSDMAIILNKLWLLYHFSMASCGNCVILAWQLRHFGMTICCNCIILACQFVACTKFPYDLTVGPLTSDLMSSYLRCVFTTSRSKSWNFSSLLWLWDTLATST